MILQVLCHVICIVDLTWVQATSPIEVYAAVSKANCVRSMSPSAKVKAFPSTISYLWP